MVSARTIVSSNDNVRLVLIGSVLLLNNEMISVMLNVSFNDNV